MVKIPECLLTEQTPGTRFESRPFVEKELTEREVFDFLDKAEKMIESSVGAVDAPPALILLDGFGVCPQSLSTAETTEFLRLQSQCEKYHVPPYAGTLMANQNVVLEAFEAVEAGMASSFRHNIREMEKNRNNPNTTPDGRKKFPIGKGKWG